MKAFRTHCNTHGHICFFHCMLQGGQQGSTQQRMSAQDTAGTAQAAVHEGEEVAGIQGQQTSQHSSQAHPHSQVVGLPGRPFKVIQRGTLEALSAEGMQRGAEVAQSDKAEPRR